MTWQQYKDTIENVYCPGGPKNGWTCGFYSNAKCPGGDGIGIKCKAPSVAANDSIKGPHCKVPDNGQWAMITNQQYLSPQCSIEKAKTCTEVIIIIIITVPTPNC